MLSKVSVGTKCLNLEIIPRDLLIFEEINNICCFQVRFESMRTPRYLTLSFFSREIEEFLRIIEEKTNCIEKAMEFENAEIEELKKKDKKNDDKIKELEDKLLYQEVYNRRENLRFFGIPESTTAAENIFEVMRNFLKEELDLENADNIEFQRAHRIGKKKLGEARPVIVRFLKFPERELVFRKARVLESDTEVKVYSDLPKEISERRKRQWPRLKKAREEGKIAFFSKPEPYKLYIDGQFVPL